MATLLSSLKPVQEILQNDEGGVVPEQYIQRKTTDENQVDDGGLPPLMDNPPFDFSLISSSSEQLDLLSSTFASWGCIQLINHGISSSFLDEVREISKEFFKLPSEIKEKYSSVENGIEGYGNDNVIRKHNFNWNWNDKLHLQVHPPHKRHLQFWPQQPHNFKRIMDEFTAKTKMICEGLLKAMAISLNLKEDRFFELWGNDEEDSVHARFNYYPRCVYSDQVIGLHPHSDGTAITILLPDKEVEGLQVLKDGRWFRVPIVHDALVINVGDQLEITSNGIFKSPIHKARVSPEKDRISVAMLYIPSPDKEIGPLEELVTEDRPQLYKRLKNYGQVYFQYLSSTQRQINYVKIPQ